MGFKRERGLFAVIIIMLFFISAVHALEDDEVTITSDKDWITASEAASPDYASIEVIVNNISVSVQSVDFSVSGTGSSGTLTPASDSASPWVTSFYSDESGTADIQVTVNYIAGGLTHSLTKEFQQKIDHAPMYSLGTVDYEYEVTVNEAFPIVISAVDSFGNRIDSRYEDATGGTAEYFGLISSPENSEFWDGSAFSSNTLDAYVNSTGYATAIFRVSETSGTNIVNIDPSESGVSSRMITITGLANAEPTDILVIVDPSSGDPPYLPADGVSKFYITYQLIDQWGNPSCGREIAISSSDPAEPAFTRESNSYGRVEISYGPQITKGIYTLIATSVDNVSLSEETDLEFVSTDPTDMLLTANPQVMPSHDVDTTFRSAIRAKVIDEKGNPVNGETVTFSIVHGEYPVSQVAEPYLESTSALTDQDGQAIVNFVPGAFETDWDAYNFMKQAEASCQVRAQWEETVRFIDLEWKNYPYLSVQTSVDPETVKVNDTVAVTVKLIGDGWALQPDPIDVMMVADRSGSMLKGYPDRMVYLMDALKVFEGEMKVGRDRLGLTSFGTVGTADILDLSYSYWAGKDNDYYSWYRDDSTYISNHYPGNGREYGDYATIDIPLTLDFSNFDYEVDRLVPYSGTPLRKGLYTAIDHVDQEGREDAVKAVVMLSDGDYGWFGDPLARGSPDYDLSPGNSHDYYPFGSGPQNMSALAISKDIRIYSIAFGSDVTDTETLSILANSTGGKFYSAPDEEELEQIYKDIAGELQEAAGVDTEMELMFQNVELNNVSVPNTSEDPVLEYVYDFERSTAIENFYGNGTHTFEVIDQSAWWNDNKSLQFDVGTVYLNQTWQTTFLLKALKPGNINLFNQTSYISFNGGEEVLQLPDTYITAVADLNSTGVNFTSLDVSGFKITDGGGTGETIDLEWTLDYTGSYSVSQTLYYMRLGDYLWTDFKHMPGVAGPVSSEGQNANFGIVSQLPPGEYKIRLIATATDTSDVTKELSTTILLGTSKGAYIKIE